MGIAVALLHVLAIAGLPVDTVRIAGLPSYAVSRVEVVSLSEDGAVRARLPWSSPSGVLPSAWCEGPDRGLIVLEASKGGRIVHLSRDLRTVSVHPLPDGLRPSDLARARASWDGSRGLSLETVRPPRMWRLGFLSGPVSPEPVAVPDSARSR